MSSKENSPKLDLIAPNRPAMSLEEREDQLCSLAVDLAEKQLIAGTASAQVITHFLKLASTRERIEREVMINQNLLLQAKVDNIKRGEKIEDLYLEAVEAIKGYRTTAKNEYEDI